MADFPGRLDQLVLASSNPGKLRELSAMLQPLGVTVRTQGEWKIEDAVEDGLTFVENALIKARHASRHTGLPALGDDSGLVVDALQGKPGIYSSRYAGPVADDQANNRKLLEAMKDVPAENRSAHFYCAMAWLRHAEDPAPLIAIGSWLGFILDGQRGKKGFGYDPLFWLPSEGCTSAELAAEDKNRLSHRGQALSKLVANMKSEFTGSESGAD